MAEEFVGYYETNKKAIFNYVLYRVSFDRYTAEDLTSEIFLKAFSAFKSFDRKRSFKTWIFTIAHNHLINYYSSKKPTLSLDEAYSVMKEDDLGAAVDKKDALGKVFQIVEGLPEASREIVIMRFVNDLEYDEIASVLGKEQGTVRTALSRAITAIKEKYDKQ